MDLGPTNIDQNIEQDNHDNTDHADVSSFEGGLDEEVNEKILHAAFIPFGDVTDINIPLDYETGWHYSHTGILILILLLQIGTSKLPEVYTGNIKPKFLCSTQV